MRRLATALILLAFPALAEGPGGTPEIELRAHSVDISPHKLNGLHLRGTVSLNADHKHFGGFSGLLMNGTRLIAVSDRGWWLLAEFDEEMQPLRAGYAPMLDSEGARLERSGRDAEGLTRRDAAMVVSFERDDRLMFHLEEGKLGETIRDRDFEKLSYNQGLEALATTPDGWIIAIAEKPEADGHPLFLVRYSGEVERHAMPAIPPFFVTGADVGPDGKLYVLRRHYAALIGVSMRIHRYALGEDGVPIPETVEQLAAFESESGIDNMEGIALWQDGAGRTRLAVISDDNFNLIQRTLLMDFEVLE